MHLLVSVSCKDKRCVCSMEFFRLLLSMAILCGVSAVPVLVIFVKLHKRIPFLSVEGEAVAVFGDDDNVFLTTFDMIEQLLNDAEFFTFGNEDA